MSDLDRFLQAQSYQYETALKEIQNGRKQSHWMWYIFPQLRGLGQSSMAWEYGIADLEEAKAYASMRGIRRLDVVGDNGVTCITIAEGFYETN